jgi:hypothetical protein
MSSGLALTPDGVLGPYDSETAADALLVPS